MNGKLNNLTMTIIQKCCNHVGTTWRPRLAAIQIGKHRCHHVEIPAYSINTSTLLCIVMRHVKHVTLKKKRKVCDFRKSVLCITNTTLSITLQLLIAQSLNNNWTWMLPSSKQMALCLHCPHRLLTWFFLADNAVQTGCAFHHRSTLLQDKILPPPDCDGERRGLWARGVSWAALWFTAWGSLQSITWNCLSEFQVPSSWAVVKAACKPSSSMIEQLRFRSQTVPTSAIPRVSHVLAPQRSCKKRQFHY